LKCTTQGYLVPENRKVEECLSLVQCDLWLCEMKLMTKWKNVRLKMKMRICRLKVSIHPSPTLCSVEQSEVKSYHKYENLVWVFFTTTYKYVTCTSLILFIYTFMHHLSMFHATHNNVSVLLVYLYIHVIYEEPVIHYWL
jgi:hypothetical protein